MDYAVKSLLAMFSTGIVFGLLFGVGLGAWLRGLTEKPSIVWHDQEACRCEE